METKIVEGCIGCGLCVSTCPSVFEMDNDGKATVIKSPDETEENLVKEASENCPVNVIVVD